MGLANGIHGWCDVAVPDMAIGEAFYVGVFGWDSVDGGGGAAPYTMFTVDDRKVAGMGLLGVEQEAAGPPPRWSAYVIVDDAAVVFATAVELGAAPLLEPTRIMGAGTMAFVMDPVGATIGFWEAGSHEGAELFNVPGAITWNDLECDDVDAAKSFYGTLLGWEASPTEMDDGSTYWTFSNAGRINGGIWDTSYRDDSRRQAQWLTWFIVDDCESTARRVEELGGTIRREPQESAIGVSAVVADPFGATFGIIETDQVDGQPPR